jgi:hypothetical protein
MNCLVKFFLVTILFVIATSLIKSFHDKNEKKENFGGGALTQLYATGLQDHHLSDGLMNRFHYPFGIWNIPTRTQSWWNFHHIPHWEYPWRYTYY